MKQKKPKPGKLARPDADVAPEKQPPQEQTGAERLPHAAAGAEFREVDLGDYVREFSVRFCSGVVPDKDTAQFIEEISSSLGWPKVTLVRNVEDPELPRCASPEAEAQAILTARDSATACLAVLRTLVADGDKEALAELVHQLADNVSWLEGYSYRDKGNLKALAASGDAWPVMLNRRPRKHRQAVDYLERIGLGPKFDPAFYWPQLAGTAEVKDPEPLRFENPEIKAAVILNASYSAGRWLGELRLQVGDGSEPATLWFVALVAGNVVWLERFSYCDKSNLKAVASLAPVWPVLMARCSRRTKAADDYLKRIELGSNAQISSSPKWGTSWGNEGAVATHYARGIRDAVGHARGFFLSYQDKLSTNGPLSRAAWEKVPKWIKDAGKLEPLTKKSAPKWFEIGWQLILKEHKGHPENVPELRAIGGYRKLHSKLEGQQRTVTPRTAVANICDGIKSRIRGALVSLAPVA